MTALSPWPSPQTAGRPPLTITYTDVGSGGTVLCGNGRQLAIWSIKKRPGENRAFSRWCRIRGREVFRREQVLMSFRCCRAANSSGRDTLDLQDSRRHQNGEQYAGVGRAGASTNPRPNPSRRAPVISALEEISGADGASALQVIALMCFSDHHCTLQALFSILWAIFPLGYEPNLTY